MLYRLPSFGHFIRRILPVPSVFLLGRHYRSGPFSLKIVVVYDGRIENESGEKKITKTLRAYFPPRSFTYLRVM